ncbi:MAG: ABC transporter permease [Armatimonadetes bacterium]|nr:ABC transporter permease [Armatimonadota bacterium]
MKRGAMFWFGISFLAVVVLVALIGPAVTHSPFEKVGTPFAPTGSQFWLGTDEQGRDIFARLAYGARISLGIGLTVQALALVVGITLGTLGVYGPNWIRVPILRFTDAMFAFPDVLLAILIIGVWSTTNQAQSILAVIASLAITAWPSVVRLVRAQVATYKDREFVLASQALGASTFYSVTRHVLPHLGGIILAVSMVDLAGIILAESALSFLGIGVQPPIPSWGSMINQARLDMASHPVNLVWPCLVLSLTIFSLNFLGDGLRALSDPKSQGRS